MIMSEGGRKRGMMRKERWMKGVDDKGMQMGRKKHRRELGIGRQGRRGRR